MAKKPLQLAGAHTALVTPLTPDGKDIDWDAFEQHLAFQYGGGIHGLVPTGTTGGAPSLTWDEHHRVIRAATNFRRTKKQRRMVVTAGTGSNDTNEALEASLQAAHDGADYVLLHGGYYVGANSEQMRKYYYGPIAAALLEQYPKVGIIIYEIPGRGCTLMRMSDLKILAETYPNIVGFKDATGDVAHVLELSRTFPAATVLSGDDSKTYGWMDRGAAKGVISVMSNIAPKAVADLVAAMQAKNDAEGDRIRNALDSLFSLVGLTVGEGTDALTYRNPCSIMTMMGGLGMNSGVLRGPLGLMPAPAVQIVRNTLRKVWGNDPWVLEPVAKHYGVDIAERLDNDDIWTKLTAP